MKSSQHKPRLPSKTQYIAQATGFVPSNLYKPNNSATSFITAASKTFNQNMDPNETQRRNEGERASSLGQTIKPSQTSKSLKASKNKSSKQKPKRKPTQTIGEREIEMKRSLLSGGSSVSGVSSPPSRTNFKRTFEDEEEQVKGSKFKRSASEQKQSLPGNYTGPDILYKGVFQNNYMMADAIEVRDNDLNDVVVRKDSRYFEEQYNQDKKPENLDFKSSHAYLENKLSLYKLVDNENVEPNPQPRRIINITDNINNSHNHFNHSFVPQSFNFEKVPGYVEGKKTRTEKEKSILKIQSLVRGMIDRKRIASMKDKLKRHFNGDLDVSPYEIEFCDLNVPVFKQILGIKGENKTMTEDAKGSSFALKDDDPQKKLLSNTFYSVLRSGFFPEDPMDYVVLAELQDEQDATFPKLIKEQQKANSKEVMLAKKYEYLFGKPSLHRELKTDDNSVIKNFLKSNLASLSVSDLKVGKFQTDYKSIIKPKPKNDQPTYVSPAAALQNNYTSYSAAKPSKPVAEETNPFKKFDSYAANKSAEKSIQSEISEDYSNDFEEDSAIKESIYDNGNQSQSGIRDSIRESIRYSMDESRLRGTISESIKESLDYASPPKKLKNRFSNKSISEEIAESYGMGRNSSVKSIQEDIPLSESIVASRVDLKKKRKPSTDDDIEEDIDIKDSYGNEEFESLEESIQESIDKFQAMRKSPSPDKKEKKPAISPRRSPEQISTSKPAFNKPVFKKSASKDEEVSPIIPKPQNSLSQKINKGIMEPILEQNETKKFYKTTSEIIPEEKVYNYGYEEERREERRKYLDDNLFNLPKSNNAEILFTNFQKELEKMLYMDSLTQKVGALENTIDKLYTQKEFNLLNSLQNRASSSTGFKPTQSINSDNAQGPADNNFMMFLMQKNNALERSMQTLSKQMNFLINNFTGSSGPGAAGTTGTTGTGKLQVPAAAGAKAQRKPRPIIPVRRSQSSRPQTADAKAKSPSPVKVPAATVQKEVKKEVLQAAAQKVIKEVPAPVKEQPVVKETVKEQPQPLKKLESEKKPNKFAFKFSSEAKNTVVEDEEKEITLELPSSIKKPEPEPVPVKTPAVVVVQPEVKPEVKQQPEVKQPVSTYKSARFGKWQQESSSEVEEEVVDDFSVKDYSESFEKLSPLTSPKKAIITKFEDKKIITPKQDDVSQYSEAFEELTPVSTTRKPSPQKFEFNKKQASPKNKSEEDIDELIVDEDIDLPSDTKEEPPVVTKPVFPKKAEPLELTLPFTQPAATTIVKKPEPEPSFEEVVDDEEYGEEDFEELSLPSEAREEEEEASPVKLNKTSPKAEIKKVVEEVVPPQEKSWSEDLEASQDMSEISWQGEILSAQEAARAELKQMQEKKADNVADAVMESLMQQISKDLFPKRNNAQIEDVKTKIKHANISEQQTFDVHQDVVDQVVHSPKQEEKIEKAEEQQHHLQHYKKVEDDVKIINDKMSQASKNQIIHIVINHINFSDPHAKLVIFDKCPVKDESVVDAYNEIFLNLFRSEFRKLNTDFATTPRVQAKMEIKLGGLIARSKEILLKRISQSNTIPEYYSTMGKKFDNIYDTLRNKKMEGEENDFYEEEQDIKRLVEEENNKLKEQVADQVMETLFEETVRDLIRIAEKRKKL